MKRATIMNSAGRKVRADEGHHLELTEMKREIGKFKFSIPEGHEKAGERVEKAFEYDQCETEAEAQSVIDEKNWAVLTMVNDALKSAARSNAYQNALAPYRPSEVSPEDIKERMIRDFIRLGFAEDVARAQVEGMLAAKEQGQ